LAKIIPFATGGYLVFLPSRKACKELGVTANALRRWANDGQIRYIRNPAGQRLYDVESFVRGSRPKVGVVYARVSSAKQRDDLGRQVEYLKQRYPRHEVVEDVGSGLNFKRKGLISLLERAHSGDIQEVVVAHRDRLCRFGFDLLVFVLGQNGCKIVVLDDTRSSPQQELVTDLLNIVHVFSCRLHGLRGYSKKIKEDTGISADAGEQEAPEQVV